MPRITSKGQVTIPKEIRDRFGLLPGSAVEFEANDDVITVRKADDDDRRGWEIVRHLRRHGGDFKMSTEEIMALTRGED